MLSRVTHRVPYGVSNTQGVLIERFWYAMPVIQGKYCRIINAVISRVARIFFRWSRNDVRLFWQMIPRVTVCVPLFAIACKLTLFKSMQWSCYPTTSTQFGHYPLMTAIIPNAGASFDLAEKRNLQKIKSPHKAGFRFRFIIIVSIFTTLLPR